MKRRSLPVADNGKGLTAEDLKSPPDAIDENGVTRRRFFGILGASATMVSMTGCVRKPVENILPFAKRPEDMIPGKPMYYATAWQHGGHVEGLIVESQDGRPTKVEGNPKHSGSQGGTSQYAQAMVLDLYDPERSRAPRKKVAEGADADPFIAWPEARAAIESALGAKANAQGKGLGFVVRDVASPTHRALLKALRARFPQARVFVDDPLVDHNAREAAAIVTGQAESGPMIVPTYHLDGASVIFAADADILGTEPGQVRMAREWSKKRVIPGPTEEMSRFWVAEPHATSTGVMADHRIRVKASDIGNVLLALARELLGGNHQGVTAPPGLSAADFAGGNLDPAAQKFVKVLAKDLAAAAAESKSGEDPKPKDGGRGAKEEPSSAVIVGRRQPAWVHAVALAINAALGNLNKSVRLRADGDAVRGESVEALAKALSGKELDTVLCFEANPAYDAPAVLGLPDLLAGVNFIHFGQYFDETAELAQLHVPLSHPLEAWGDLVAEDGTITVCQPLIDPLHGTYSSTELLGFVVTGKLVDGYSLLKGAWQQSAPNFSDRSWRTWLHDGVVEGTPREGTVSTVDWAKVQELVGKGGKTISGTEINFHVCPKLADGRFSTNGWMQELPHPMTKLTWDNAAYVSPAMAAGIGVGNGDMVRVTVDGRTLDLALWIAPGQADDTVSITMGGGRRLKHAVVITNTDEAPAGADVNALRDGSTSWFVGGSIQAIGGTKEMGCTQDYGSQLPPQHLGDVVPFPERPIALESDREGFRDDPNFVEKANLMDASRLRHLWDPPKLTGKQQWGMSIDLNTCTGCNTCVVACQSENNIPVVGKKQILNGREMHWIRIDRYYQGDENDPSIVFQAMTCQHCESAPCETVCPVGATVHSPEGLNDMAYNRCIGTRYCSNNCPYKVRRYNFFNYNMDLREGSLWTNDPRSAQIRQMQKNPDVTIRFRGVMEKCTYCVQRINSAKIEAHVAGKEVVEDGAIIVACQQACPTGAIVFGDIRDPDSAVSKAKRSPRDYKVLRDLNTGPRTTYLARIRNPHPEMA